MANSDSKKPEFIVPNAIGAKLVKCSVSVNDKPPTISTMIETFPIIAFAFDGDQNSTPLIASNQFIAWDEYRAAAHGCYMYGIVSDLDDGVSTFDHYYDSLQEFEESSKATVASKVAEVREEKGWPEDTWPSYARAKTKP